MFCQQCQRSYVMADSSTWTDTLCPECYTTVFDIPKTLDDLDRYNVINLTSHKICLNVNGNEKAFPPSNKVAQVVFKYQPVSAIAGFNLLTHINGIPEKEKGTIYLVPGRVLSYLHNRPDVFAPDTGPSALRDGHGHIRAVTNLLTTPPTSRGDKHEENH